MLIRVAASLLEFSLLEIYCFSRPLTLLSSGKHPSSFLQALPISKRKCPKLIKSHFSIFSVRLVTVASLRLSLYGSFEVTPSLLIPVNLFFNIKRYLI
jgi:hypothetical protein